MLQVIVTGRNTLPFLERHMKGLLSQEGVPWHCTWVDDASDDGTVEALLQRDLRPHVSVRANESRRGPLANVYDAVHDVDDDDVIVLWDADDFFTHHRVLARIAKEFENPECWMTYGSFLTAAGRFMYGGAYPKSEIETNAFRRVGWKCAPPRAFRAWLFKLIPPGDLKDEHGKFWDTATDQATCLPMLEMAGKRARHIPDILYIYSTDNPQSDHATQQRLAAQTKACLEIRRRKPLDAIAERP